VSDTPKTENILASNAAHEEPIVPPAVEHHGEDGDGSETFDALDLEAEALANMEEDSVHHPRPALKQLLTSEDIPSRFMTVLSIAFATLAVLCAGLLVTMYFKYRKAHAPKPVVVAAPIQIEFISQALGEFTVSVKSADPKVEERQLRAQLTAQCTTQETCDELKSHLAESRDLVLPVLSSANQEDFFNVEAKTTLRNKITDRLNSLTLPGKVSDVNFTNLAVEKGR
jgi:flagellar basal body-associated protein FliL